VTNEESTRFFKKKRGKKLLPLQTEAASTPVAQTRKSFLRRSRPDDRAQRGLNRAAQSGSKKRPLFS
jgi:hypothetical protein